MRFCRPEPFGESSSITWNCEAKISTPIPASIPWMTAGDTARNTCPTRNNPAAICTTPARRTMIPSVATPNSCTNCHTMTASPAAGPLTCSGEPAMAPTTMPPTMPVTSPAAGGSPDAIATPMQRGRATRKTTTEARASAPRQERQDGHVACVLVIVICSDRDGEVALRR